MKNPTRPIHRKRLTGTVVSAGKMAQTITVLVERRPWHPTLRKQYRQSKQYLVHDAAGAGAVGDHVVIEETRPLSKRKHFRLLKVVSRPTSPRLRGASESGVGSQATSDVPMSLTTHDSQ